MQDNSKESFGLVALNEVSSNPFGMETGLTDTIKRIKMAEKKREDKFYEICTAV